MPSSKANTASVNSREIRASSICGLNTLSTASSEIWTTWAVAPWPIILVTVIPSKLPTDSRGKDSQSQQRTGMLAICWREPSREASAPGTFSGFARLDRITQPASSLIKNFEESCRLENDSRTDLENVRYRATRSAGTLFYDRICRSINLCLQHTPVI